MERCSFLIHRKLWKSKGLLFASCGRAWYDSSKDIRIPFVYDAQTNTVLEWGFYPEDLDSHLFGPGFHVYCSMKQHLVDGVPVAELDFDDTWSYGPETTTIYGTLEGEYLFVVDNYSRTPDITVSDARVKVYSGDQRKPYATFTVPKEQTGYRYWKVFKYNSKTRSLRPINEMSNVNGY